MSVTPRYLKRLFEPETIAIAGLSADPNKHGRRVLRNLQNHGFDGTIWGVNPKLPVIDGVEVFATVGELPAPPDVLVVTVPAEVVPDVLGEAAGAGSAIIFAGGFAEAGPAGVAAQERLVEAAQAHVPILGPNSGGIIRPGLPLSFLTCLDRPADEIRSGPVALVTQSGGTGSYLHNLAAARGSGFAMSISTGNELGIDAAVAIYGLTEQSEVRVIALVLETIRDGLDFAFAVRNAHAAGKRVVACRFGTSGHGQAMMATHTAAMAHPRRLIDGMLWSLGVPTAETPAELLEVAEIMARVDAPPIESVGIVTHSGGIAILLADLCEENGVRLRPPSDALIAGVEPLLEAGAVGNPLDMGGIIGGPERFAEVVERFAAEYDVVLAVSSAHPPAHTEARVASLLTMQTETPIVHLWMAGDVGTSGLAALRSAGAPVTDEPRAAIRALAALATTPSTAKPSSDLDPDGRIAPADEVAAKELLREWGVPVVEGKRVSDVAGAVRAAGQLGYPVVVKALAPGLLHKTEANAVAVGLRNESEVRSAAEAVAAGATAAGHPSTGFLVERWAPGIELIVGGLKSTLGPMVSVGLGGTLTEAMDDLVTGLAPLSADLARQLISRLHGIAALTEPRSGEPADLDALAGILATVGEHFRTSFRIEAFDINPLAWTAEGWLALDAAFVGPTDDGETAG